MVEKLRGEEPGRREKAGVRYKKGITRIEGGGEERKKFPCTRAVIISTQNCRVHNYSADCDTCDESSLGQLRDKC